MTLDQTLADGSLLLALAIALAAGLLSFLSPCVLPLVPGYLAYVGATASPRVTSQPANTSGSQTTSARRGRVLLGALLFVLGFTVVLVAFLGAAGTVGVWLIEWEPLITRIMGVVIIVLGLVFMGAFSRMQRTVRPHTKPRLGLAGAPLLGATFAIGWTPCIGPTLAVIGTLSLQQGSASRALALAVAYCLGLGIPFVLAATGFAWMTGALTFLRRHIRVINLVGGVLMVLIGLLMVTGLWSQMMYALQAVIGSYVAPL